jgi:23S rRNA (cytosine1962-C5)-methyltransferase
MQFKKLVLKEGKEKSVFNRHPWIFSGAVQHMPNCEAGDMVAVYSARKQRLGTGFIDPGSQIICRIFHFSDQAFPPEEAFWIDYWSSKIQDAMLLRKQLPDLKDGNCYRLIHAEGDGVPGVIADVYAEVVSIQLLIPGTISRKNMWIEAFKKQGFNALFIREMQHEDQEKNPGTWVNAPVEKPLITIEHGLKFWVDIEDGQKTGFFIDQRANRKLLGEYAKDRTVLNAFSYSGGFSVYALAGGAKEVHSLDVSASALQLATENVEINQLPAEKHHIIKEDCFKYLKNMPGMFDLIVLDPPAFAKSKGAVDAAARGYKQINMEAIRNIQPNGLLFTYSCSHHISRDLFRKIVFGAAADVGRDVQILHHASQSSDHPVNIYHPESEYLKGLVLWVR